MFIFILDIDECANNNGDCGGTCINTPGSFECYCDEGFGLDSDGITCSGKSSTIYIYIPWYMQ